MRTFWFGVIGGVAALLAGVAGFAPLALLALVWLWCAARWVRTTAAWERAEWIMDPGRFV